MNNWKKLSEEKPIFGERVLVFNTRRNKYEVFQLNWEDSKNNIWWIRQGGSVLNIDDDDWWTTINHFTEKKVYK